MKNRIIILLAALLTLCLVGCGAQPAAEISDVAILYTNDVHCAVDTSIGYAGLCAYEKELESDGVSVLLADCGDAVQGAPVGALSKGENIVKIMNAVGYDVAIPGNHEFDYGMEQFKTLVEMAEYPYISANFVNSDNTTVLPSYTLLEAGGRKIGFVGVTTPYTVTSSTPAYFMNENGEYIYGFLGGDGGNALYDAVQSAVDSARKDGAEYVIVLSHLGIEAAGSPYTSTELIENTNGINAVLDGHSHSVVECERVKNKDGERVLLSQTGTGLEKAGLLYIDKTGSISTGLISSYAEKDEGITSVIDEIKAEYETMLSEKVAVSACALTVSDPETEIRLVRRAETNLGDLCADAYLAAGKTDVAFVNGGGIRSSVDTGDITYGDIVTVFPFGNMLCTVEASGQEIADALEHGVRMMPEESGAFLQVAGMTFTVDPTIPSPVVLDENGMFVKVDGVRRVSDIMIGGEPIDLAKTYTVTSHNYLLKSFGDGYTMFADNVFLQDEFIEDYRALINYFANDYASLAENYANPYGNGRIIAK